MAGSTSLLEASQVLEAALKQMDGILGRSTVESPEKSDADTHTNNGHDNAHNCHHPQGQPVPKVTTGRVLSLLSDLKSALQGSQLSMEEVKESVSKDLLDFFRAWVFSPDCFLSASGYLPDTVEDKVRKLEAEKQSLTLQVNVLTEQLEAQGEKIADLELHVADRDHRLSQAQDRLQAELVSRTNLESGKLDLMNEVAALSVKVTDLHNHIRDLEQRYRVAQRQLAEQEAKLLIRDAELAEMRQRFMRDGSNALNEPGDTDVERLRRAVDTLMFSNDDKDRKIEELRRAVKRYRRIEELLIHTQGKTVEELLQNAEEDSASGSTSSVPTPSPLHTPVRDYSQITDLQRNGFALPNANGTPGHSPLGRHGSGNHGDGAESKESPRTRHTPGLNRSDSCENITVSVEMASPDDHGKRTLYKDSRRYGMLAQHSSGSFSASSSPCRKEESTSIKRSVSMHSPSSSCTPRRRSGISVLTRAFFRLRSAGKHSQSAPNLVGEEGEVVRDAGDGLQETEGAGENNPHHPDNKKNRRLRQLFSKLKRSSSQNFDGGRDRVKGREFQRGGARATAVARLADWSPRSLRAEREVGFSGWDGDRVASWLMELDLTMYLAECRRWVTSGQQLLQATPHDLEKELGMKNPLHRKKLHLAMQAQVSGDEDAHLADVDHNVVARWLDDIGLPQYKDAFYDARVDGRMLHHLTVDDLLALKVNNELHHLSIKRGIQVLRLCGFHVNTLQRRPLPHEQNQLLEDEPGQVMLWTSHRVMEWLRTIDLSEYAPNMRGSGVHGALMVLEPRFNAELMAVLLSIPAHKTLLRRHLCRHFVSLIGPHTQARKRQFESSPDYQPLVVNAKVRRSKSGLFGHRRSRSEVGEVDRLICPVSTSDHRPEAQQDDARPTRQIGTAVVSKEIGGMTVMLNDDKSEDSPQKT